MKVISPDRLRKEIKGLDMKGSCFTRFVLGLLIDILDYLGDKVIPNAELWRDKSFFKDGGSFMFYYRVMLGTGWAPPLYSRLILGSTA